MMSNLFPLLYGAAVIVLLVQAVRVMSRGFLASSSQQGKVSSFDLSKDDRTGRVTVHPELLNQEGLITDEELLTVRFSEDAEPPLGPESSRD